MNARAKDIGADDVEEPAVEERSVRDELEASLAEAREPGGTEAPGEEAAAAPAEAEERVDRGDGRDQHGRFIPKGDGAAGAAGGDPAAGAQAAGAAQPGAAEAQASQVAPAAAQVTGPDVAPNSWTPAAKAKWNALPPEIRAEVARREQEIHRTITRQDEHREYGRQFAEISQQNAAAIQRAGVHPLAIYRDFLQIMNTLNTGDMATKVGLLRQTALQNGIDLRALVGQQPAPGQPGQIPQPQAVIPPELQRVATEWTQFKSQQEQERQAREQQQQQATYDEIVAFRSKPEARYFDAVKDTMVALLQTGAASNLSDAYQQAIWTRPDIREQLQNEAALAARNSPDAQRQRAAAARARGGSVRGGSGTVAQGAPENRTLREELQAGFAEARARV
jgi:hypothetical protein